MPRLPQPGGDAGNWGVILNDYLSQAHTASGVLKDDSVGADQLQNNSVTASALADNSVTAATIVDGSITSSQLSSSIQTSLSKADTSTQPADLATKYTKPSGGIPLSDMKQSDLDHHYASSTYALIQLARVPDTLIAGSVARNNDGVVTSATVIWPDGSTGTYTTDSIDTTGAVNSYHITYGSPVSKTFTQPGIVRNTSGQVITIPAMEVA